MFNKTRISVFGGRDITDSIYNDAYELGKLLAQEGYLVYCGGGEWRNGSSIQGCR